MQSTTESCYLWLTFGIQSMITALYLAFLTFSTITLIAPTSLGQPEPSAPLVPGSFHRRPQTTALSGHEMKDYTLQDGSQLQLILSRPLSSSLLQEQVDFDSPDRWLFLFVDSVLDCATLSCLAMCTADFLCCLRLTERIVQLLTPSPLNSALVLVIKQGTVQAGNTVLIFTIHEAGPAYLFSILHVHLGVIICKSAALLIPWKYSALDLNRTSLLY